MHDEWREPIHITVPGAPDDPRVHRPSPPGVIVHYSPPLHPDDVTVVRGLRVTSVSRTLIDCAEEATEAELREMFRRAEALGILDLDAVDASLQRVEWRPSLPLVRAVLEEFRVRRRSA